MTPVTVTFDLAQLGAFQEAMARMPAALHAETVRYMHAATAHLQGEVVQRTPTSGAGTLRQSIIGEVKVAPEGFGVTGLVGTSLAYAQAVELGARPHMPPVAPLIDWARRKLGLQGDAAESAGWAIAKSIARRGTLAVGMFHRTYAANKQQLVSGFERAVMRALGTLGGRS